MKDHEESNESYFFQIQKKNKNKSKDGLQSNEYVKIKKLKELKNLNTTKLVKIKLRERSSLFLIKIKVKYIIQKQID